MVGQKITCASGTDNIGNRYFNSNTKRHGFFANESQDSKYFESGRDRSFNARKASGQPYRRSDYRRNSRHVAADLQLYRGKRSPREYLNIICLFNYINYIKLIISSAHISRIFTYIFLSNFQDYLKPEPVFESTMYHDTDCEFFQDLVGWCSDPAKEELVQTIDSPKLTEDRAYNTDTLHNSFSPQGWDGFDANSPAAQASFYNTTPKDPLSPVEGAVGFDTKFTYNLGLENERSLQMQEQFLDISSLPVVIGGLASADAGPWAAPAFGWAESEYTKPFTDAHNTLPFIHHEDSLDMKYMRSVTPREVESGAVVAELMLGPRRRPPALDLAARAAPPHAHLIPSTPEVLSYVEQLEQEKYPLLTTLCHLLLEVAIIIEIRTLSADT